MRSLEDVEAYAENENDVEVDISKYISFCIIMLKTAILITDSIFNHYVNNCIFPKNCKRKIKWLEKECDSLFNRNTTDKVNIIEMMGGLSIHAIK